MDGGKGQEKLPVPEETPYLKPYHMRKVKKKEEDVWKPLWKFPREEQTTFEEIPYMPYPELKDLIETVKRECKTLDDLLYNIRVTRTRPYSRIAAIVFKSTNTSVEDACKGVGEKEVVDYVRKLKLCNLPKITVYRGSVEGSEILAGDWIALEYDLASWYGIVKRKNVSPSEIVWAGTYPREWYYIPSKLKGMSIQQFWRLVESAP
ncbi:hypothetical protein [Thermofilum sp.]|uniref:hypothetical protein n=1 Tax=Thermofilum sp. TaxID=1961369 RepID=UPI0031817FBE